MKNYLSNKDITGLVQRGKTRYTESELLLPALQSIAALGKTNTSQLINTLIKMLRPRGHDAEIIPGRQDTYFSQKVRNLKSHNALQRQKMAIYKDGYWIISKTGLRYLSSNKKTINKMLGQGFKLKQLSRKDVEDYSSIIIEEGGVYIRETKIRKRSNIVRTTAINSFKKAHNNKIYCTACAFSFAKKYGRHGRGFIEVHHHKPIFDKDIKGERAALDKILKSVSLLCSNCHRMVHRVRNKMLTNGQLKSIIRDY